MYDFCLCTPYSFAKEAMYEQNLEIMAHLFRIGLTVTSDIIMCHEMAKRHNLPTDQEFWRSLNHTSIACSVALLAIMFPFWEQSAGVTDEIWFAKTINKQIVYATPEEILLWT